MNSYHYDDIKIGMQVSFSVDITDEMMQAFLSLTGDDNPMHVDEAFAQEAGFKGCLVYGMLTASFYSTLVGVYLPGRYALLQEVETTFNKPVYVGDRLTIVGVVAERYDSVRRILIKARVLNEDGVTVSRAKIKAGVSL